MRKFNYIYDQIVNDENDLVGIIAYSIYKKNKVEYITKIKKEKSKKEISETDLEEFVRLSCTATQIDNYRNDAKLFIKKYSQILLSDKLEEIEQVYKKKAVGSFFRGVFQSVIGSILFTIFLGLLIIILWSSKVGTKEVIENIFNIEIIDGRDK
jgi:hypothetical protein